MRTTAELAGERLVLGAHGNDADDVAVFLAKEGDSTGGLGLVDAHDTGHDRLGSENLLVNQVLDSLELLGRQGLEVREVKAQVLGRHQRAGLGDMLAQYLLKRSVEQMRGGVVAAQETTALGVERGGHGSTDGQRTPGNVRDVAYRPLWFLVSATVRTTPSAESSPASPAGRPSRVEGGLVQHHDALHAGHELLGLLVLHHQGHHLAPVMELFS